MPLRIVSVITLKKLPFIFFYCSYASKLWYWLFFTLNSHSRILNWDDVWSTCRKPWSDQCAIVVHGTFIHLFNTVLATRNIVIFKDKSIQVSSCINLRVVSCSVLSHCSKVVSHLSISNFAILKNFKIKIWLPKSPKIMEVIWKPPPSSLIKVNYDRASLYNLGTSAYGGIFKDHKCSLIGVFSHFLGVSNSFISQLSGAMSVIEFSNKKD